MAKPPSDPNFRSQPERPGLKDAATSNASGRNSAPVKRGCAPTHECNLPAADYAAFTTMMRSALLPIGCQRDRQPVTTGDKYTIPADVVFLIVVEARDAIHQTRALVCQA